MIIKIKIPAFLLLLSVACFRGHAQQIFRMSQFIDHNFIYNPAAAGANANPSVGLTYKKMWSGIDGGPSTLVLFGDHYFPKMKAGLGAYIYNDVTGPTSRSGAEVCLSYSVPLSEKRRLMFGLSGQVLQERLNLTDISKYISGDPLLFGPTSVTTGDASAGVYYTSPTLNLGASAKQLIESKLQFIKSNVDPNAMLYRHFYFMGSYNIRVDESNVLVPNVLVKYLPNSPVDLEAGMKLQFRDQLFLGLSFHYKQNYILFAGLKLAHRFQIGYSYEQYNTPLSLFDSGGGGNELMLRYFFGNL